MPADADLLLGWANDPVTRAAGFHHGMIERDTHVRWLADRLASPSTRLWIGRSGNRPVGQVRIEAELDGTAEVGIAIAPEARGRGFGTALLRAAIEAARNDPDLGIRRLIARVRVGNVASVRLFESAGFRLVREVDDDAAPHFVYELPA